VLGSQIALYKGSPSLPSAREGGEIKI